MHEMTTPSDPPDPFSNPVPSDPFFVPVESEPASSEPAAEPVPPLQEAEADDDGPSKVKAAALLAGAAALANKVAPRGAEEGARNPREAGSRPLHRPRRSRWPRRRDRSVPKRGSGSPGRRQDCGLASRGRALVAKDVLRLPRPHQQQRHRLTYWIMSPRLAGVAEAPDEHL